MDLIILNTRFGFWVDIDPEINLTLTTEEETLHGQGGDTLYVYDRANALTATIQGTATDLIMGDTALVALPGVTILTPSHQWQYRLEMGNTKDGSTIVGSIGSMEVFTSSGSGSLVNVSFTWAEKIATLNITQTLDGYHPTDQDFSISKGDNSIALVTMTPTSRSTGNIPYKFRA